MPYDYACVYAGVQPLSDRRFEFLNWRGGSFARSHNLTAVYTTFFPNGAIQQSFPASMTLSTQYHELTKRSFIPYLNISNLIHKIALSAPYRRLYTDVWEGAQAVWVWGTPSWDRATENREFFTQLPVFYVQLKVIQSKFCLVWRNHNKRIKLPV